MSGALERKQKMLLIKSLIELAEDGHIPLTIAEITAKVAECLGREVTGETVRTYLSDCGFTYKSGQTKRRTSRSGQSRSDRVAVLAKAVEEIAFYLGVDDESLLREVHRIATKQSA